MTPHRRDTESTEGAQSFSLCNPRVLCVCGGESYGIQSKTALGEYRRTFLESLKADLGLSATTRNRNGVSQALG